MFPAVGARNVAFNISALVSAPISFCSYARIDLRFSIISITGFTGRSYVLNDFPGNVDEIILSIIQHALCVAVSSFDEIVPSNLFIPAYI